MCDEAFCPIQTVGSEWVQMAAGRGEWFVGQRCPVGDSGCAGGADRAFGGCRADGGAGSGGRRRIGAVLAIALRWRGLAWSWALPTVLVVPVAVLIGLQAAIGSGAAAIAAVTTGVYLHGRELLAGGDLSTRARQRRGITDATRARAVRRRIRDRRWVTDEGVAVGQDRAGAGVRIPVSGSRAAMTLVAGATGSGKR